jgi:hypothetical protein
MDTEATLQTAFSTFGEHIAATTRSLQAAKAKLIPSGCDGGLAPTNLADMIGTQPSGYIESTPDFSLLPYDDDKGQQVTSVVQFPDNNQLAYPCMEMCCIGK